MVLMASRLGIVLSGLVLACSCDANGLRLLSAHDAGDTGGSDGANPAEAPAATGGSDAIFTLSSELADGLSVASAKPKSACWKV
jgi:hypothetical protein